MNCSIKKVLLVTVFAVTSTSVYADFDEATKAYLLGDFEKARYEALIAATDGSPQAQMLLGQIYFHGEGVKKDLPLAMYWYEKSAANNFDEAQFRLGVLYLEGKDGVTRDYDKAYQWLKKAADYGYRDAEPKLEALYKTDSGKVVNLNESLEVLQQAAGKGEKIARFLLSEKLLKGDGVTQDKPQAVRMLTDDARRGFVKAQKRLGELYYYGDGVEQDFIEAYGWSMAYAGTNELGGLAREGKQTARSSLRKLDESKHNEAYLKSKQYFEQYVLPFHKNAREVGPDKYRIVVRSRKQSTQQASQRAKPAPSVPAAAAVAAGVAKSATSVSSPISQMASTAKPGEAGADRSEDDAFTVLKRYRGTIYLLYRRELEKNPKLAGKVVLSIDIAPDGLVTKIDKIASELKADEFESALIERIKKINFTPKGSKVLSLNYPIEFFPPDPGSGKVRLPVVPVPDSQPEEDSSAVASTSGVDSTGGAKPKDMAGQAAGQNTEIKRNAPSSNEPATTDPGKNNSASAGQVSSSTTNVENVQKDTAAVAEEGGVNLQGGNGDAAVQAMASLPDADVTGPAGVLESDTSESAVGERDYQEVYNVLVRSKTRLNDLYLREYESDNKLQGRVVFDIKIAANGDISAVEVESSELESPTLEQALIDYLKNNVKFADKNVAPYEFSYPIDFLPPSQ